MENLGILNIGDIVEIEFKRGSGQFKDHPSVTGYVSHLPDSVGYLGLGVENPLLPEKHFQFTESQTLYPISNMKDLTILKKLTPE